MKEYSCCNWHQFSREEVKDYFWGCPVCPYCWPKGFMISWDNKPKTDEAPDSKMAKTSWL